MSEQEERIKYLEGFVAYLVEDLEDAEAEIERVKGALRALIKSLSLCND